MSALLPIVIALLTGTLFGHLAPVAVNRMLVRVLPVLIAVLLFVAGATFGDVFTSSAVVRTLLRALCYSAAVTLGSYWAVALLMRRHPPSQTTSARASRQSGWRAVRDCGLALALVGAGALLQLVPSTRWIIGHLPSLGHLVWLLVALIGTELVRLPLAGAWRQPIVWLAPLLTVGASLAGGVLAAWTLGERAVIGLVLASGFGWFSMSGALVASRLGDVYGALALSTDLFRELLTIVVLYASGARRPAACVAAAGATALDSTLPIIRQTCAVGVLPLALFSGFLLSILAPILMSIFLSFA